MLTLQFRTSVKSLARRQGMHIWVRGVMMLLFRRQGGGVASGGLRDLIPTIARTAVAVGVDGIFMEVIPCLFASIRTFRVAFHLLI